MQVNLVEGLEIDLRMRLRHMSWSCGVACLAFVVCGLLSGSAAHTQNLRRRHALARKEAPEKR